MAAKSLKTELKRSPNNVLLIFGDAVKISPNCLRGLFQTAIRTSRPDEGLLQQMIKVALNHYPEESNSIAEVCMEEVPDKAGAIKAAFVSVPKLKKESNTNTNGDWKAPVSPIDRFLNKVQKMPDESSQESSKDEEADQKIMKAMEKMAAKVDEKSGTIPNPTVSLPNALVEEKLIAGQVPGKGEKETIFAQPDKINVSPDVGIDAPIELKTLGNTESLKMGLDGPDSTAPVIMLDNESEIAIEDEEVNPVAEGNPPSISLKKAKAPRSLNLLNTPSAVYYIPPPAGIDSTNEALKRSPNRKNNITLRSNPISPTSPR